jgi:hypothetical protein
MPSQLCAGIGTHCQINEHDERGGLMIQATIPLPNLVLQVESQALLLAAWLQL